jgi:DNA-binding MarR family transcriptional regulator
MIRDELGMFKGDVCRLVGRLERKGFVSRVGAGRVRRIRISETVKASLLTIAADPMR